MSDSQQPNPYDGPAQPGQPNPYGGPGQPNPYEHPAPPHPYGQPGGPVGGVAYAHWGKRVGGYLIDGIIVNVAAFPAWIGYFLWFWEALNTISTTDLDDPYATPEVGMSGASLGLILLGVLTSLAVFVWNTCFKGGGTGWTIGRRVMGIRLLSEQTGQPIGAGMAFVRQLAHIVDSIPCNIGYLWPLWDAKRQTFADKIIGTIVIEQPKQD